jgi:hypothetical protein
MSGTVLTSFDAIDLENVSGLEFRRMVAKAIGFPEARIDLLSKSGDVLQVYRSLQQLLQDASPEEQEISVACVLTQPRPIGPKNVEYQGYVRSSKGGMVLVHRLRSDDRLGRPSVTRSRNPDPSLRSDIQDLIAKSFAPGLAPLIEMGLNAAFHDAASNASQDYIYEDANAIADLSSCRVWAYSVQKKTGDVYLDDALNQMGPVLCTVLWRLLPSWQDKGPVLEILFLATCQELREMGWANELEGELEALAKSMGCSAIAVAAVPVQGMAFWTKRCGFEVLVPLKDGQEDEQDHQNQKAPGNTTKAEHLEEPVNELGEFLLKHMLLFTDTPLVAKVLAGDSSAAVAPDGNLGQ